MMVLFLKELLIGMNVWNSLLDFTGGSMNLPGHNSAVAPGMTHPVEAGQTYEIEDDTGQSLVIEARDSPAVIAFIHEFDNWLTVDNTLPIEARDIRDATWASVMAKWQSLPKHVTDELPSTRSGGIVVAGGAHAH
jgi:hypothetical protein